MPRCYEPAPIVVISKSTYVPATSRRLDWRRVLQRTSTNSGPVAVVLPRHPPRSRQGTWRCPCSRDGLRRRDSGCGQPRSRSARCPAPSRHRCRGRRGRVLRQWWLAFPGVPGTTTPRGGLEVRLGKGGRPMGVHPRHVCSRDGTGGRHRAPRCRGVAVRARRRVRAVPDLPQRALALRTAPRSHPWRLPAHVRRPDARSKDAAVTRPRSKLPAGSISWAYRKPHTCWQHHVALTGGMTYRRTRLLASPSSSAVPTTGLTIYGCQQDEAVVFRELAPRFGVLLTITEAAVSEANVELAFGTQRSEERRVGKECRSRWSP